MLVHHVQTLPVPPSLVSELPIPKQLGTIVMTCLEKDPAKRLPSALELDAQLAQVRGRELWSQDRAQRWWETHAPR